MRIIKFDTVNPEKYLNSLIEKNEERVEKMNRQEMLDWIIATRSNFSDFYTFNLRQMGWEAEEFIVTDRYLEKVEKELYGSSKAVKNIKDMLADTVRPVKDRRKLNIIKDYINRHKPDVIFVREQIGIPSEFWSSFSRKSLIVSRIAAPVPRFWSPADFDLIFTSTEIYKKFFELNNVRSVINANGFEERVLCELKQGDKLYNTTFVGGLGDKFWLNRTSCMRYLAQSTDIKWWGYNEEVFEKNDPLRKVHQGLSAGLEMLQIYRDSKIVFNDYGEIADGMGVNQRIFEVLGVGSFLLTRKADNLEETFPKGLFEVFTDEKDCLDKINYFLRNEKEREEIAAAGQQHVLKNYSYKDLAVEIDKVLRENYKTKFGRDLK